MFARRGFVAVLVVIVAAGALMLGSVGCDDDFEDMFDDVDIRIVSPDWGGRCGPWGWGRCGGYYYTVDRYDWWGWW